MKTLLVLSLLVSSSAFAEGEQIVQALMDNNAKLAEMQAECASAVREVVSKSENKGIYTHTIQMGRQRRGEQRADCLITIIQDYTPTYHDGSISYKISIKNSK